MNVFLHRELFLNDPENSLVQDPYCHLINVFDNFQTFKYVDEKPKNRTDQNNNNSNNNNNNTIHPDIPQICDKHRKIYPGKSSIDCSSKQQFLNRFNAICPALNGINWSNIFVAGGSVLACLLGETEGSE